MRTKQQPQNLGNDPGRDLGLGFYPSVFPPSGIIYLKVTPLSSKFSFPTFFTNAFIYLGKGFRCEEACIPKGMFQTLVFPRDQWLELIYSDKLTIAVFFFSIN